MRHLTQSFILIGALSLTGCGKKSSGSYSTADAATDATVEAPTAVDANDLWEQRADPNKLKLALERYEQAYNVNPRDKDTLIRLTRGWYFYGDAYVSDDAEKEAAWDTAIGWGKKCMGLNREFSSLLDNESEATATRVLTENDVACTYWTATALGKWAGLKGLSTILKHKGTVFAYVTRVTELKPEFFYNAPDRYWGAYYSALPSFAGQDLGKSETHFEASIAGAPGYMGTRVLKAQYWAVKTQNKEAFESLLNEVISADISGNPKLLPENTAEQAKARALLAQTGDLFAD
jgi:hypothetical protein